MNRRTGRLLALSCATLLTAPLLAPSAGATTPRTHRVKPAHHHASGPQVVVSGLNNPRELAFAHHGTLLVAEAGKGGPGGDQFPGEEGPATVGFTGSITAVSDARHATGQSPHRIVTGLMSTASPDGSGATGSDGVATGRHDRIYIQETYIPPAWLAGMDTSQNGMLLTAQGGHVQPFADISGYEAANDPDGHGFDSDPYAVIPYEGGHLVADAAGNDVVWVSPHGYILLFHVFPNVTTGACASIEDPPGFPGCNFVPNALATDKWGNVYVGGLSSLTPGEAQVVELNRFGQVRKVWKGFTSVTGLAVRDDGTLYVSQLFAPEAAPPNPAIQGVVTTITRSGTRTNMDVPFPTGLALRGHNLFVSAFSIAPDTGLAGPGTSGQVWRIPLR